MALDRPNLESLGGLIKGVGLDPLDLTAFVDWAQLKPRSRAESEFSAVGPVLVGALLGSPVVLALYEWFAFNLPGGSYTADFYYRLADGRLVVVEVKGSKAQTNYRDARSKLRAAATLNPFFVFVEALKRPKKSGGGFSLEVVHPDRAFLMALDELAAHAFLGDLGHGR